MGHTVEGSTTKEHQLYMMNEMAKLVRPEGFTSEQVGMFVEESFQRTADISLKYGLIEKAADLSKAYDQTIYEDSLK
jgi:NitT/TauT family transport system substrate-binding protein